MLTESFRRDVESFLDRTGMTASAFGKAAVGDSNFVTDLRSGRSPGLRLVERVTTFMHEHERQHAPHEPERAQ